MSPGFAALIVLAALIGLALLLVGKLFWPARGSAPDADDPWAQHNERRTPSLEHAPEAGSTEVDAAVAAQIMGSD